MANNEESESATLQINPKVKEITEEDSKIPCDFCGRTEVNKLMFGPLYHLDHLTVHYFCMLFSAGLSQYGEDNQGILGFLPKDIQKELARGRKLKCKYCKRPNATVGCSNKKCKASFHYPCGLEKESNFQFLNNYESYCSVHKREVKIPLERSLWECSICYIMVEPHENPLFTPCCQKGVFHRTCIMQMAEAHGSHFFKCPLCNDRDEFSEAMRFNGVYVPDRDAVWELEPNAFSDLNQMHNRCDAVHCLCPKGREYSSSSREDRQWRIVRCGGCGAEAVHKECGQLELLTYRCDVCASVLAGAAVDPLDSDDDEDMMSQRRRQTPGHTPGRRIIRRGFDGSDDELELPPNRIREFTRNDEYGEESDDSGSSSSSCSFEEVTGVRRKSEKVVLYGKQHQLLGHNNDDDDTESDESEDDEEQRTEVNYFTTDTSVTVDFGNNRKPLLHVGASSNGIGSSGTSLDSDTVKSDRPVNFHKRYTKYGQKLEKLKMLSEQIVKTSEQESGDTHDKRVGQGRAGLVARGSYSPEEKLSQLLKQSLSKLSSNTSMRSLRSSAKLPEEVQKQLFTTDITSDAIEKVTSVFSLNVLGKSPMKTVENDCTRLTRSRSKDSNCSSQMDESPHKKIPTNDPLIQKIVSSFSSAITVFPLGQEKPCSSKSCEDIKQSPGAKRRSEEPVMFGPRRFKIPKKATVDPEKRCDSPSASTRQASKSRSSPTKCSLAGTGVSPLKNPIRENDVVAESNYDSEQNFLVTVKVVPPTSPVPVKSTTVEFGPESNKHSNAYQSGPREDSSCNVDWDLPILPILHDAMKPRKTVQSISEFEQKLHAATKSNQISSHANSQDDDDDVVILEDEAHNEPSSTKDSDSSKDAVMNERKVASAKEKTDPKDKNKTTVPSSASEVDSDDDIQMEVIRLAPVLSTEDMKKIVVKSESPAPRAAAFQQISESNSSSLDERSSMFSSQSGKYYNGHSLSGMSAALIAMSSSYSKKVISESKAGTDSDRSHEIVIVSSDDEEVTKMDRDSGCNVDTDELNASIPSEVNNPEDPKTSGEVNFPDCSMQPNPQASSCGNNKVSLRNKRGRDIECDRSDDSDSDTPRLIEKSSHSEMKRSKRLKQ